MKKRTAAIIILLLVLHSVPRLIWQNTSGPPSGDFDYTPKFLDLGYSPELSNDWMLEGILDGKLISVDNERFVYF